MFRSHFALRCDLGLSGVLNHRASTGVALLSITRMCSRGPTKSAAAIQKPPELVPSLEASKYLERSRYQTMLSTVWECAGWKSNRNNSVN